VRDGMNSFLLAAAVRPPPWTFKIRTEIMFTTICHSE
jgi:hypothetical protein